MPAPANASKSRSCGRPPGLAVDIAPMRARLVAAVAIAALAGCGHGGHHAPSRPARDAEPFGHLSRAEYAAIVKEYARLKPLQSATDVQGAIRRSLGACGAGVNPNTRLMTLVRKDCVNALGFFAALAAVESAPDRAGPYEALSLRIHDTIVNAQLINSELRRRRIGGLCARSIGITPAQIRAMGVAATAAGDAGAAAAAGDTAAFLLAQHRLTDALANEPGGDPLTGIRHGCRTSAARRATAPRTPRAKPKPHRHQRPRVPSPHDQIKA
jgi:hypothetical protein